MKNSYCKDKIVCEYGDMVCSMSFKKLVVRERAFVVVFPGFPHLYTAIW